MKPPVKPTEIGMGQRQQHTWRVSLCFLTVSALSVWLCVCLGWGGGDVHTTVFLETTWYERVCPLAHMAQPSWRTISECVPPLSPYTPPLNTHPHTFCIQTHTCIYALVKRPTLHMVSVSTLFALPQTRSSS